MSALRLTFIAFFILCRAYPAESSRIDTLGRQSTIFSQPVAWVGKTPPSDEETTELTDVIEAGSHGAKDLMTGLEQFVEKHPQSPWAPSLRATLGVKANHDGRYSVALRHWEQAWQATRDLTNGPGVAIRDSVLANWATLLSSLGRIETLRELHAANGNRVLSTLEFERIFKRTALTLQLMENDPAVSFRCGTLALAAVGRAQNPRFDINPLKNLPSPPTGFSMAKLNQLSKEHSIDLVAVFRPGGTNLIVPSVVHWKENHYAAIVATNAAGFHVSDPTFGGSRNLTLDAINAETDGFFMVPSGLKPADWKLLSELEAQQVFGRGANGTNPPPPTPPCNAPPGTCCISSGGPGGSPGGGGSPPPPWRRGTKGSKGGSSSDSKEHASTGGCTGCQGMPVWRVSEPWIAPQLEDVPVTYTPSTGTPFDIRIFYDAYEERTTNYFGFGPQWSCNLSSYVRLQNDSSITTNDQRFTRYSATVFGLGGGQLAFSYNHHSTNPTTFNSFELVYATNAGSSYVSELIVRYPDGAAASYALALSIASVPTTSDFFLTSFRDRIGRAYTYQYSTNAGNLLLSGVIDPDGKTNVIRYHTNWITRITEIETPVGGKAKFAYDGNGVLTNITDAIDLSSGFSYSLVNGYYFITTLRTPYGETTFDYIAPGGPLFGTEMNDGINRAVTVTEPNNAKHIYMYRDDSGKLIRSGVEIPFIDWTYSDPPSGVPNESTYGYCNNNMKYRNTFYWGPRQVAQLSSQWLDYLMPDDYLLARLRNWLHTAYDTELFINPLSVGSTLNMERDFAPTNGVAGQKTWYAYRSKFDKNWESATNNLPWYIAQRLSNGETRYVRYEYNAYGKVLTEAWTTNGTTFAEKTRTFLYAANGIDLVSAIDFASHVVQSNIFNSAHQVIASRNAVGEWSTNTYDTAGHLTSARTPAGLTTTNLYDSNGFLTNTVDLQITRTNSFTYTNGLVYTHSDERGLTTTNRWDVFQRLVSTTYPDGTFVSNRYDKLDLFGTRDRLGNWTYFAYDGVRNRTGITNALTNVTTYAYCNCGALDSITDALTNTTYFYYDYAGRQIATVYPDNSRSTNVYDITGDIVRTFDSSGSSVTNTYSHQGYLVSVSNSFGLVRSMTYDIEDRMTNSVDASGVSMGFVYDDVGRVTKRTYPDTGSEKFGYNVLGLANVTNQNNNVTRFGYDAAGRKTRETNANNEVVQFAYNAAGDLTSLTDGKNQVTQWKYDEYGRVTNKTDAASTVIFTYRYDANGRLTNRWTPAKGNTFYTYDAVGNLKKVDYTNSTDLTFTYDKLNRMTRMTDATGTSDVTYTSFGAVASEDGPWPQSKVTYGYSNQLLESVALNDSFTSPWQQSFTYDLGKRLKTVTSPAGTFTYNYQRAGMLYTNLALPNGAVISNKFDSVGRMLATVLRNSSGTGLDSYVYKYDLAGQRTNVTRTDGTYVNYAYDKIGQLTVARAFESNNAARSHERHGYRYDTAHNLQYRTNNTLLESFTLNNLNQISSESRNSSYTVAGFTTTKANSATVNGSAATLYNDSSFSANVTLVDGTNTFTAVAQDSYGRNDSTTTSAYLPASISFSYDANGNLLSDGRRHFTYDDENQLTQVVVTNSTKSIFTYDGKMRRRVRVECVWFNNAWHTNEEVRYVYDGNLVIQERYFDQRISAVFPLSKVTYTRGNDFSGTREQGGGVGGLLARRDDGSAREAYYHWDGNGNVTALVDSIGVVVARYIYSAFGQCLSYSGPLAALNLYQFSSKETHVASGILYYGLRFYDSRMQKWLTKDPLHEIGGLNVYGFVNNAPIHIFDAWGLKGIWGIVKHVSLELFEGKMVQHLVKKLASYGFASCWLGCDSGECESCCGNVAAVAIVGLAALAAVESVGCAAFGPAAIPCIAIVTVAKSLSENW